MRTFVTAGFLAAGLIAFSGAASAQEPDPQPPMTEEYCVYGKLIANLDYEIVAEAYLTDDAEDQDMTAALKRAVDACAAEHGMNNGEKSAALEVGIYGSTADYLAEELLLVGVDEDVVDSLYGLVDEISDADLDVILESDWRQDAEVTGRLKAAVLSKGVPDNSGSVDNAIQIVELSTLAMDAVISYMIAGVDEDDS